MVVHTYKKKVVGLPGYLWILVCSLFLRPQHVKVDFSNTVRGVEGIVLHVFEFLSNWPLLLKGISSPLQRSVSWFCVHLTHAIHGCLVCLPTWMVNVGKYTVHGCYGLSFPATKRWQNQPTNQPARSQVRKKCISKVRKTKGGKQSLTHISCHPKQ